jgi:S1-C subfamily serine protease
MHPSHVSLTFVVLIVLLFPMRAAAADAPEVWKCVEASGKPHYTNQQEDTRGRNCVQVKREISVVPGKRPTRAAPAPAATDTNPLAPATPRAAARIEGTQSRAERAFGSGFVVSTSGDIMTNAHLVQECGALRIRAGDQEPMSAAVVAQDQDHDLALLRMERPWGQPAILRADAPLQTGESVWVLGYPLTGLLAPQLNITQGIVSATAGVRGDAHKVQITNPIQTGNSGGPLVDHSGNVVGVVAGKLNALRLAQLTGELPQNVNFAIKLEPVTRLLSAARVDFQRASVRSPVETVSVVRDARRYTVLIECET